MKKKQENLQIIEKNIFANRHIDNINDNFKGDMTIEDIIEGINNLNNLNITKNDITWNQKDLDNINDIFQQESDITVGHGIINIKFNDEQNVEFNINRNLNLNRIINNFNIGNVYIPRQIIKDFIPSKDWIFNKYSATSLWMVLIMEFVGNLNKILSYFQKDMIPICTNSILSGDAKNTIADKSYIILNTDLSWKTELAVGKQYSFNLGQNIKVNYIINIDNRIKIQDAIQNRNLENLKIANMNEIKEHIFEKNKDFFISKNITKEYVIDYLNVKEINNNYCIIDWLPGSDKFCGHDIEGIKKATENAGISDEESLKKYDLWIEPVKINFSFEKKQLELQQSIKKNMKNNLFIDKKIISKSINQINNEMKEIKIKIEFLEAKEKQWNMKIKNKISFFSKKEIKNKIIFYQETKIIYLEKYNFLIEKLKNINTNDEKEIFYDALEYFKDEINSIDLQNQPSTSSTKLISPQI